MMISKIMMIKSENADRVVGVAPGKKSSCSLIRSIMVWKDVRLLTEVIVLELRTPSFVLIFQEETLLVGATE
jgi:hypothetical protein